MNYRNDYKSKELVAEVDFISEKIKREQRNFSNNKPIIINFAGKKGSGKTYYLNYLLEKLDMKKAKIKKIDCKSFEQRNFNYSSFEKDIFGYRGKLTFFISEIRNLYYLIALIWISFSFILIILDQSQSLTALWIFLSAILIIFVLPIIPLFFNKKTVYIFDEINRTSKESRDVETAVYRFISEFKEKSKQNKFTKNFLNLINIDYRKIIIIETSSDDKLFNEDLKYIDYVINTERSEIENIKIIRNELNKSLIKKEESNPLRKNLSNQIIAYYIEKNNYNLRISILELKKIIEFYIEYNKTNTKETNLSLDTIIVVYNLYKNEVDWKLFKILYNHFKNKNILNSVQLRETLSDLKNKATEKILFDKLLKDNFIISIDNVFKNELKPIIENIAQLYLRKNIFKKYKMETDSDLSKLIKAFSIEIKNEEINYMILIEDLTKIEQIYQEKFFNFILNKKNKEQSNLNLRSFLFGEIEDPIINWKYQILHDNFKEIINKKIPYFKELFVAIQKNNLKPLVEYFAKNKNIIKIPYFYEKIFQSEYFSATDKKNYIGENFESIVDKYIISNNYSYQNEILFDEILNDGYINENELRNLLLEISNKNKYKNTLIKLNISKNNRKIDLDKITLYDFIIDDKIEIRKNKKKN